MSIALTSPVTGGAQTGFTAPTYTVTADTAPDTNGKQWAVTALGGTQAGVTTHGASTPFTITFVRPKVLRTVGLPDPVTGVLRSVARNVYKVIVRKAVLPLAGQSYITSLLEANLSIPAGADAADPANIRAALSLLIGSFNQQSAGLGDTLVTGIN